MLDVGLSRRELEQDLAGLGLDHKLKVTRVKRGCIQLRRHSQGTIVQIDRPRHRVTPCFITGIKGRRLQATFETLFRIHLHWRFIRRPIIFHNPRFPF